MRYLTTTKNLFNQVGAALILNNASASAAPVNWYSWEGSKIYINRGSSDYGMTFPPITLSAGTYTLSAMASMNDVNGSGRVVSIGYLDISNNWYNQFVTISSDNQKISYTFTLTEEAVIRTHLQGRGTASNYSNLDTSFWDIQLELGDTATDYVPYGYLPMYKGRYKVSDVCQLVDKSKYSNTNTINGITFTNNKDDGTITVNGTATKETNLLFGLDIPYPKNHITLIIGTPSDGTYNGYYIQTTFGSDYYGNGAIKKQDRDFNSGNCYITVDANTVCSNVTFKPQLFDLTEMYGAGNEPTTVAEFREKFPNDLYPYSPYCWARIKSLIYKDDINYIKMK